FETPFEIEFVGEGNQTAIRRFEITPENTSFIVTDLPFEVVSYVPNPHFDIVCDINETTMNKTEFELDNSHSVILYPNPAKNQFTLEYKNPMNSIKVFETSGKLIYDQAQINQNKWTISIQNWPKGMYMVQIQSHQNV